MNHVNSGWDTLGGWQYRVNSPEYWAFRKPHAGFSGHFRLIQPTPLPLLHSASLMQGWTYLG